MDIIEILKQIFSATDEQTTAVKAAMKEHGIYTTSHENMDVRYPKIKTDLEGAVKERDAANATIEELKKASKGQEALQSKITAYEEQMKQAQEVVRQTKINAAIKVGLLSGNAIPEDIDYLTFRLNEMLQRDGKTAELDDNDAIKGWDGMVESLKTACPKNFNSSGDNNNGFSVYEPNALRKPDANHEDGGITKERFDKMGYNEKAALRKEHPETYDRLTKG